MSDPKTSQQAAMNAAERTQDGRPELADVNRLLREQGEETITRSQRDRLWETMQGDDQTGPNQTGPNPGPNQTGPNQPVGQDAPIRRESEGDAGLLPAAASLVEATDTAKTAGPAARWEPPPGETVRIKITSARTDTVHLYVHGLGRWELAVGTEYELPAEAVAALQQSDIGFERIDDQ